MKAATHYTYGSPEVLTLEEVETPTIKAHDILIEVHASPVTQGDRRLRAADYPGVLKIMGRLFSGLFRPRHRTPGSMFAGKIVSIGAKVTRFSVGDDVFGSCLHGGQAQYLSLSEDAPITLMPSNASYEEAAATPYGAVTALVFLRDLGNIQQGQRVLILGASGGVGRFAVQLARHFGAEVTGVCSKDHDLVRELGADHLINYKTDDFTNNGQRYDIILDTIDATDFNRCKPSLTSTGKYLSLHLGLRILFQTLLTSRSKGRKAIFGVVMDNPKALKDVRDMVEQGAIRPIIESRYPLQRIQEAHARLEAPRPMGSVVVTIASPLLAV